MKFDPNKMVTKKGKFFELGDYPDKKFSLNYEEAKAAEAKQKPLPLNVQHTKTVFDGLLGTVNSWKVEDDKKTITAEYSIPEWLDNLLGSDPIKVSPEWHIEQKTAEGCAIVVTPRVRDAAIAAYCAFNGMDEKDIQYKESEEDKSSTVIVGTFSSEEGQVSPSEQGRKTLSMWKNIKEWFSSAPVEDLEKAGFSAADITNGNNDNSKDTAKFQKEMEDLKTSLTADFSAKFSTMDETIKSQQSTIQAQQALIEKSNAEMAKFQVEGEAKLASARLEKAIAGGFIVPAKRETLSKFITDGKFAEFSAVMEVLETGEPMPVFSQPTPRDSETLVEFSDDDNGKQLVKFAQEIAEKEGIPYHIAFGKACSLKPRLADAYRSAQDNAGGIVQ